MDKPLQILVAASEAVPFVKTGGLADVIGALPKALAALGHDVRVVMPRYQRISPERFNLRTIIESMPVPIDHESRSAAILEGRIGESVPVYFVDLPNLFAREGLYGYSDDGERFVAFCRAALELCRMLGRQPDVVHCHDWHTGIIPNWLATIYRQDAFFASTASLYTIHNLQYQGIYGWRILEVAGIDEYGFIKHQDMADLDNVVDLMARGILFADAISTVSERYAREILTPERGERLDPILRERQDRLFGILNGIDQDEYNPRTDPYIAQPFGLETLDERVANKTALQREANLPERPEVPIIGMISRLSDQKGLDILEEAIPHLLDLDLQLVILGTGDQHYHDVLLRLARQHQDKLTVFLTFNTPLARKIYAGSDLFLMPSRVEPCGLGQMVAYRYGSIPVVRATGGLADTVPDYDPHTGTGNGFAFTAYDPWQLFGAVVRAIEHYRSPATWRALQQRAMQLDFSWRRSAERYVEVYRRAIATRGTGDRS